VRSVSAEAIKMLTSYRWPGNVRQLENAVFRAVVLADTDEIGVAEFPQIAAQVPGFEAFAAPQPLPAPRPAQEPVSAPLVIDAPETAPAASVDSIPLVGADGHVRSMEEIEATAIRFAIAHYRGRMTEVSRRLGIGRSTLYRKLKDLGVATGPEDEPAEMQETAVSGK
jgi:DNA-binding NtrC family response regulator